MTNQHYNITDSLDTCTLCHCAPNVHIAFWQCPILKNKLICSECCIVDCLKNDIDTKFSNTLKQPITKEEINKTCQDCGRNNGCQNEELAKKLENEV